ncbi:MAG: bifunctional DNA-formamidopyrimidine glycosylase/DNA-(apurinic or apyrimidinic site) lyase [Pseudomonadota bacterium]
MPELPEVETVRRGLAPVMEGARIEKLEQRRPDLRFPLPERFRERVEGRLITRLARRAKYLLAELDGGATLLMHLGMSGRFTIEPGERGINGAASAQAIRPGTFTHEAGAYAKHDHVVFHMGAAPDLPPPPHHSSERERAATRIIYNDARRFGFMVLIEADALASHPLLSALGPEPLSHEISVAHLSARAMGRQTDLKAFLLDQRNIAGLGNIYVCEALFRAGLSPNRRAACLATRTGAPTQRAERLLPAIQATLRDAIAAGGSTLRDYQHADGTLGYFQHTFAVYGREGEPCRTTGCNTAIRRRTQAGRSTFFCPRCQR